MCCICPGKNDELEIDQAAAARRGNASEGRAQKAPAAMVVFSSFIWSEGVDAVLNIVFRESAAREEIIDQIETPIVSARKAEAAVFSGEIHKLTTRKISKIELRPQDANWVD
jgi:hypothetical protein